MEKQTILKWVSVSEVIEKMKLCGRTWYDREKEVLYFNWTCGGFEIDFRGTMLLAELCCSPDTGVPRKDPSQADPAQIQWPWYAVYMDDEDSPWRMMPASGADRTELIFSGREGRHRIRFVKLTENFRTYMGIRGFWMCGELGEKPAEKKRIEFIGDSITCGFGLGTTVQDRDFYTAEEDGWRTHGAITARKLDMDPQFVSISGITLSRHAEFTDAYGMEELYRYTDRFIQDAAGYGTELEKWDFEKHRSEIVVLNLGTNDAAAVQMARDPEAEEKQFEEQYYRFLTTLRDCNGPDTWIICALGSMDYYLYANIRRAVERFVKEKKDGRIYCMKYKKMALAGGDAGACYHPSAQRQAQMAEELTAFIRKVTGKGEKIS